MAPSPFATPPHPITTGTLSPFNLSVPDSALQNLRTLLALSPIAPATYTNNAAHAGRFGVTRDWLISALSTWADPAAFDWRAHEAAINSIPQFTLAITDDAAAAAAHSPAASTTSAPTGTPTGKPYTVHFAALFSPNPAAVPVLLLHGWPGAFTEFLPLMRALAARHAADPAALPFHIIAPSLAGFGFSSPPPPDADFRPEDQARVLARVMRALGFGRTPAGDGGGYVVQGGDVGSVVGTAMAAAYADVRALHVNFLLLMPGPPVAGVVGGSYSETEAEALEWSRQFFESGSDYARLHGNRPSTAGLVVGSSPVALLAWIGEKMLAWADPATVPSLDEILRNVSLYWFTGCYPTSIWFYRNFVDASRTPDVLTWKGVKGKPFGFSAFRREISLPPKAWLDAMGNISWYRKHDQGGHFAALEQPDVLWKDIVDFIKESGL